MIATQWSNLAAQWPWFSSAWLGGRLIARGPKVIGVETPPDAQPPLLWRPRLIDYGPRQAAARGLYRIFNTAGFRFYRSAVAPPAPGDTPFATHATLPYQPTDTYADGVWYLSVSYFNGVIDSGFLPVGPRGETFLVLTIAGGVAGSTPPSPPDNASLELAGGGIVEILASYLSAGDGANAATQWAIAYTMDGSTPASGSPSITVDMSGSPIEFLVYDLPTQAGGTTVKVQLQTFNGSTYSTPGDVLSIVVPSSAASAPLALQSWPGPLPEA